MSIEFEIHTEQYIQLEFKILIYFFVSPDEVYVYFELLRRSFLSFLQRSRRKLKLLIQLISPYVDRCTSVAFRRLSVKCEIFRNVVILHFGVVSTSPNPQYGLPPLIGYLQLPY